MALLITFLAGCSTLLGYFFIYYKKDNNDFLICSLAFASGVMIFISLFDLMPEAIKGLNTYYFPFFSLILAALFLVIGIMICSFIDLNLFNKTSSLYKLGIISMLAVIIHNIPEGIATYLTTSNNLKLGINLGLAIAIHNIPEGISISIPIYYSTNSKLKAFLYTLVAGMSEFLGAVIALLLLKRFNSLLLLSLLYSFTAGIMIYISLVDLFPTSLKYNKRYLTIFSFIVGVIFIFMSILLIK